MEAAAEWVVIGSMLLGGAEGDSAGRAVAERVRPKDFEVQVNRSVYQACMGALVANETISFEGVAKELAEAVGDLRWSAELLAYYLRFAAIGEGFETAVRSLEGRRGRRSLVKHAPKGVDLWPVDEEIRW